MFEAAARGSEAVELKDASETRTGVIVGTMEYMAPEQARGERVDDRVDIYSFGMILYRMLVGRRLAEGATDSYTRPVGSDAIRANPPCARSIRLSPRPSIGSCRRCLQPDPALRYQSTPRCCWPRSHRRLSWSLSSANSPPTFGPPSRTSSM